MANRTVNLYLNTELNKVSVMGGGSSGSRRTMTDGDVLTVIHSITSGNTGTITVSTFSASYWTSTANLSLAYNTSGTRTVKTSPTLGTINLTCASSGLTSGTIFLEIISSVDLDPDQFNLGSDLNPVKSGEFQYLAPFTVSGISTSVTASAATSGDLSGVAYTELSVNGGTYAASVTVSNGSIVETRVWPSTTYADQITSTVTIGTTTDSVNITTEPDPAANIGEGSAIPFAHATGSVPLGDVISFFSGASISGVYAAPTDMGSYYRGGTNVPDITANNTIPLSGTITLNDFRNAQNVLYFVSKPTSKSDNLNTISAGGQLVVAWYAFDTSWGNPADWQMGYGPYIKWACEYQYSLTVTTLTVNAGTVTTAAQLTAATPTTWTAASGWGTAGQVGFGVEMYVSQNSEVRCSGYVTMQVRHPQNTGYTLSVNVPFVLNAFGP